MGEYSNACNNLLDAIQLTASSSIEKAGYDKTIQAQVLSCQDATIGKYRCRYQDAVIYAYANTPDTTYTNGAYVYILVPNGDMSNEKTILGTTKKLGINYISQAVGDQAYSITGNNAITSDNTFYLNTNNINYKRIIYQNESTSDVVLDTDALVKYIKQSSSLIVGATFKTSIPAARQTRGHYGITYNLKFLDNTSNQQVIRSYTVDEDSMIDNPYRLIYDTRQYKIFDIDGPNFIGIESIQIFNSDFPNADGAETSAPLVSGDIEITKLEIVGAIRMSESEINGIAITFYTPQGTYFIAGAPAGSVKIITAQVRVKGKLVSAAQKIPFYWGMENVNITPKSEYYNKYLGRGWECLNEGNVISQRTATTDPTVEWVPSGDTFILNLSDATAKNNRFKVAIVYDGNVITKEINIQNLGASIPDITIQSSGGTQFYYDIGHPTLTCKINGSENPEGYVYYWAYQDNSGGIESLPQTTDLNEYYENTLYELNSLKYDIEIGAKFPKAQQENLQELEDIIKHFDLVQRVKENKIYDVQINNITNFGVFKCSVYNESSGNYLGTASITLTNTLEGEGLYSLVINNGSVTYQYNENGIAPNSKSLDVPQQIQGLSFTIYDNLGNEINNDIILNDRENCKIRWEFPIKQTMLTDQNDEPSGTDPTLTYKYYDDRVNLIYNIAQKYDIKKQRNQIKLTVNYKGISLTTETSFTFVKQGQPGTNGTQYLVKLVPNTMMNNPPLWPMVTKTVSAIDGSIKYILNYGLENSSSESLINISTPRKFFKAQLWRNGELVWQGWSNNDPAEDNLTKPTIVNWEVLANKYGTSGSSSIVDESAFTVTDAGSGLILYNGDTLASSLDTPYANIIKCSVTFLDDNGENKTYYGTIPITTAWTYNDNYRVNLRDYTGWRYAIYTSDGVSPQYDNSHPFEFAISEKIGNEREDISEVVGDHEVSYTIDSIGTYKDGAGADIQANLIEILRTQAYRNQCDNKPNKWLARPAPRYDGVCVNAAITCVYKNKKRVNNISANTIIGRISVPIHFLLNKYGFSHINAWDGNSVQIDQQGGFILSPQMGAGKKDNSNNFTGVLMGAVRDPGKTKENIGLLGYADGDRTFFLNSENGSALFGKANKGQITIDPSADRALIYSGNFWKNYNAETGLPTYGSNRGDNFYKNYRIGSNQNPYGPNTSNINSQGMLIDLSTPQIYFGSGKFCVTNDGKLHATQASISGAITATSLKLEGTTIPYSDISNTPDLTVYISKGGKVGTGTLPTGTTPGSGKAFQVDANGLLQANNAVISGTVYATAGLIGGWNINETGIYNNTTGSTADNAVTLMSGNNVFTRSINGTSRSDLKFAIGKNFGVKNDGTIYASNAILSGTINSTTGSIGGWKIDKNGILNTTNYTDSAEGAIALNSNDVFKRSMGKNGWWGTKNDLKFAIGYNFAVDTWGYVYAVGGAKLSYFNIEETTTQGTVTGAQIRSDSNNVIITSGGTIKLGNGNFTASSNGSVTVQSLAIVNSNRGYIGQRSTNACDVRFNNDSIVSIGSENGHHMQINNTGFYIESSNGLQMLEVEYDFVRLTTFKDADHIATKSQCVIRSTSTIDSDIRLKTNIKNLDPSLAKQLRPVSFNFIQNKQEERYGFIAQEVQKIMPDLVKEHEDGYLGIRYNDLIAPLYALVQQQQKTIEDLESRLLKLERG